MQLRQPIIVILGHVDHGKTTLLDQIRQTAIAAREAGGITQAIGTTEIPNEVIGRICGPLLDTFKVKLEIPGLLFIDTPGHEAFGSLRSRGGSIADIAILIVDINEGLMPQTLESLEILKNSKVPFVIAFNKIDRIHGWSVPDKMCCFCDNFEEQSDEVKGDFEKKFYELVEEFAKHDTIIERFDRISDFTKNVAAIPVSAKTGEGVPELLTILAGLAQRFLKERLITTDTAKGMILEVKDVTGLGTTIDTVIYDGSVKRNDYLVIGGPIPRIMKIRALLEPEPLRDMRTEKKFRNVEEVHAASGVKIAAPGLGDIVAGLPIRTAKTFEEAEKLLNELEEEQEEVGIHAESEGLILKADTIGSLEALINVFKQYPIRDASIGLINKTDTIKAEANTKSEYKAIIGFNTRTSDEVKAFAKDKSVVIIENNVIYRLLEDYEKWVKEEKEKTRLSELESVTRPGKIKLLPGCTFRASNPAIVGCEVVGGRIKSGYKLLKNNKVIGEVKQIQSQGENREEAKIGDKIAVSITGPTIGRQVQESDVLYTEITGSEYAKLNAHKDLLSDNELSVLEEIKEFKKKDNPRWGLV